MLPIARRLGHSLLLLLGVSMLSFLFSEMAPGDYLDEMALDPRISPDTLQAARDRLGLDRPLPVRYGLWLRSVARGDFGFSFQSGVPVGRLLGPSARNTLVLAGSATALAWLLALPLGIWSAARSGGVTDRITHGGSAVLLAVPDLLLGLGLLLLAARTGWFPTGGMASVGAEGWSWGERLLDRLWHGVLPVLALTLASLPLLLRHVRDALAAVLDAPYLQAARALGVPTRRLLLTHALKAAANPLISLFGLSVAGLLSGSLLIEVILSWPGLGPLLLQAIEARDVHVVIGATLLSCGLLILGNLVADLLLFWLDPRVRAR